ncbi:hypothetical protein [Rufibacter aurantiacus]|uniref:hypothetical protein n=1 Tax=Rufibacter aurantiacus TaxID=2817374 RepID=UPI001B303F3F|nr:hypothetical protein [Rufibacter aurantiacus]
MAPANSILVPTVTPAIIALASDRVPKGTSRAVTKGRPVLSQETSTNPGFTVTCTVSLATLPAASLTVRANP